MKGAAQLRRLLLLAWDCLSWIVALLILLVIRYDWNLTSIQWAWSWVYTGSALVIQVAVGVGWGLYRGRYRLGSFAEASGVSLLVIAIAVVLGPCFPLLSSDFPRGIGVVLPPLALLFMLAGRWIERAAIEARPRPASPEARPALVYGAGDAGHQVARLVATATEPPYSIVGFVDDDLGKRHLRIRGQRVYGTGDDLVAVARARGASIVILAITAPAPSLIQSVSDRCTDAGLKLVVVPPIREMIGGRVTLGALREFNVADLLGRRPVSTDLREVGTYIRGRVVLVTGAGGSIGSELARQVKQLGPSKLVLLDRDESALHAVQLSLYGSGLLDTDDIVLCDIRDYSALRAVFEAQRPEVVFHTAALKHLPMLERFPEEGWKTNVLGSGNVLRCAREVGVAHYVNVSTDKAADPTSILGRTKREAERLTAWYALQSGLPYLSVRFGNVLGSRGSVLYTFRAQIERGGPVTVTDPEVTRYFMTIPEACELVLQAGAIGHPGDVMVLEMGEPVRIVDVAKRLIAESGRDIPIEFTGLRHGEKLNEVLFSTLEEGTRSTHPLISCVSVPPLDPVDLELHHSLTPPEQDIHSPSMELRGVEQ